MENQPSRETHNGHALKIHAMSWWGMKYRTTYACCITCLLVQFVQMNHPSNLHWGTLLCFVTELHLHPILLDMILVVNQGPL